MQKVLSYDIGGTKVEAAVVDSVGAIFDVVCVPAEIKKGKEAFLQNLVSLGRDLLRKHPEVSKIGVASAGPLHSERGILLDPTNFRSDGKRWGIYPLVELLQKEMKLPVVLENDAASAALAEHWLGAARGKDNAILLTLGTGLGVGIIHNGKLLRAGRGLHTEGGHIVVDWREKKIRCGCGNYGCAEAYLSGKHFTERARKLLRRPTLHTKDILELARGKKSGAIHKLFAEYAEIMAVLIHNLVVLYAPDIIVFSGGFSVAHPFFLSQTEKHVKRLLQRREKTVKTIPELKVSPLDNHAGILGAAYVVFRPELGSYSV